MIARRIERAIPPAGAFIDIDGNRIHYVDRGAGIPLVLIHGLAGVMQNFTHSLVDRLTSDFRVIALDRPGAGYSQRKRGEAAGLRHQAATIATLVTALGIEKPVICGHSLGGAIALAIAEDHPALARSLALIAPYTQFEAHAPPAFRGLEIASPWQRALVARTLAVPMGMLNGPRVVREIFAPEPVPGDFAITGGGLLGLRASQFYHASSDMIASRDEMPSIVARYSEITIPVHVLFGTNDAVLDFHRHGELLRSHIPQTDVRLVPGGHMLPVTQPDLTATWLRSTTALSS